MQGERRSNEGCQEGSEPLPARPVGSSLSWVEGISLQTPRSRGKAAGGGYETTAPSADGGIAGLEGCCPAGGTVEGTCTWWLVIQYLKMPMLFWL